MSPFDYGPYGYAINVEDGALLVTTCPSGRTFTYKNGPGGQSLYVDESGRLIVNLNGYEHADRVEDDLSPQIDGHTNIFTLTNIPIIEDVTILRNGVVCRKGEDNDYVLTGPKLLLTNFIPRLGSSLLAIYYKECELCH